MIKHKCFVKPVGLNAMWKQHFEPKESRMSSNQCVWVNQSLQRRILTPLRLGSASYFLKYKSISARLMNMHESQRGVHLWFTGLTLLNIAVRDGWMQGTVRCTEFGIGLHKHQKRGTAHSQSERSQINHWTRPLTSGSNLFLLRSKRLHHHRTMSIIPLLTSVHKSHKQVQFNNIKALMFNNVLVLKLTLTKILSNKCVRSMCIVVIVFIHIFEFIFIF